MLINLFGQLVVFGIEILFGIELLVIIGGILWMVFQTAMYEHNLIKDKKGRHYDR